MKASELKKKYLDFFKSKGHAIVPSASLVPENDPTVLFTTAGMHPLVPFLQGQKHPLGTRIANVQRCLRTQDIDEVGDETHTTFFEMLGNWSFGDYFKEDAIKWSWEFLTDKKWLGLDPNRLAITCFKGDTDAPKDEEAAMIWRSVGVSEDRIAFLEKKDNWWGPAGPVGPCGPDTEMFYWRLNDVEPPKKFDPQDDNWIEIWNDVFMQYDKQQDGTFTPLAQKNVDTGMGVERTAMVLQGKKTIFETELFQPIFEKITELSQKHPRDEIESFRIIADHMRASTFLLGDEREIIPSNVDQGYILRRFIRRVIRHGIKLGIRTDFCGKIATLIISMYEREHPILKEKKTFILTELEKEEQRFRATIEKGLREFENIAKDKKEISGKDAFLLFQSYGFPLEMTEELADEKGMNVDVKSFEKEYKDHKQLSKQGADLKFKGGLADASDMTVRLHTATHLLNEALRKVVDSSIVQKGSNITPERLRFDFNFDRKLTTEEIKNVEDEVNRVIQSGLEISKHEATPEQAKADGAQSEFGARYPPKVSVYDIGDYSKEICMGPHVANTKDIGTFKIVKEQSSAAGIRRIKAVVK